MQKAGSLKSGAGTVGNRRKCSASWPNFRPGRCVRSSRQAHSSQKVGVTRITPQRHERGFSQNRGQMAPLLKGALQPGKCRFGVAQADVNSGYIQRERFSSSMLLFELLQNRRRFRAWPGEGLAVTKCSQII